MSPGFNGKNVDINILNDSWDQEEIIVHTK